MHQDRDNIFRMGTALIRCTGCGVSTQRYREYASDPPGIALELAIANWNMRQMQAPDPGDGVALKRLILDWLKQEGDEAEQTWTLICQWIDEERAA